MLPADKDHCTRDGLINPYYSHFLETENPGATRENPAKGVLVSQVQIDNNKCGVLRKRMKAISMHIILSRITKECYCSVLSFPNPQSISMCCFI